jgi:hypothetical protein
LRSKEQIEILYTTYLKSCAKEREKYEAGYDPYFYAIAFGAATALGLTLDKSFKEIERDVNEQKKNILIDNILLRYRTIFLLKIYISHIVLNCPSRTRNLTT